MIGQATYLIPKILHGKLYRLGLAPCPKPFVITFSITNKCNSKCKTCNIWCGNSSQEFRADELDLDELERSFRTMPQFYYFNISGGEPFLRKDIVEIIKLAVKYLKPKVIHIPTNCLLGEIVVQKTREILECIPENIEFTIKPSFDGIGEEHDSIRGVPGNFELLMRTYYELKNLKAKHKNLTVGLGTIISKHNVQKIKEITKYADLLDPDTYINEIAENRSELLNCEEEITPGIDEYRSAVIYFKKKSKKSFLSKIIQAFRIVYYDLTLQIITKKTQVIPCYSGVLNIHMTPSGYIWPCSILGYSQIMGNLRDYDYNFSALWKSEPASKVRKYIKDKNCYCPMAGAAYVNMLVNFRTFLKVLWRLR